jgi:SNF2 family DNA or RNA helicase
LAFVGIPPFVTKDAFDKWIAKPVRSKSTHSLPTLRKLVAATCLRRTKANHASTLGLTRKTELLELVEMSPNERQLYEFFKRRSYLIAGFGSKANGLKGGSTGMTAPKTINMLVLIGLLRLVCDHGEALLSDSALKAWKKRDVSSISWEMLESGVRRCDFCGCEIEDMDTIESTVGERACRHITCDGCASKLQSSSNPSCCLKCSEPASKVSSPSSSQTGFESGSRERYPPSTKVKALLRSLANAHSAVRPQSGTPPQKR